MMRLLGSSGVDLKKFTTAVQSSQFAPEEGSQRGSLSDFLRSPGTTLPGRVQNAPAGSRTRLRGNLTDEEPVGPMEVTNIPEGVDPKDWIAALKKARGF
jgi:hypothetical protein